MTVEFDCSLLRSVYSDGPVLSEETVRELVNNSQFLTDFVSGDLTAIAKVFRSLDRNAKAFVDQIVLTACDKNDVVEASRFFAILYRETRNLTSDENWATVFIPTMILGVQKHIDSLKEKAKENVEVNFSIKEEIDDESLNILSKHERRSSMLCLQKQLKVLFGTSYMNGRMLTCSLAENSDYLESTHFSYEHESCYAARNCKNLTDNPKVFADLVNNITKKTAEVAD